MNNEILNITEVYKQIGSNIRAYRRKLKMSQEDLAFKINSARNYIGCIERAEKHASIEILAKIAFVLNVKLEDIMKDC